jgi:hypothetical protein
VQGEPGMRLRDTREIERHLVENGLSEREGAGDGVRTRADLRHRLLKPAPLTKLGHPRTGVQIFSANSSALALSDSRAFKNIVSAGRLPSDSIVKTNLSVCVSIFTSGQTFRQTRQ